jgi:hypothetical protein
MLKQGLYSDSLETGKEMESGERQDAGNKKGFSVRFSFKHQKCYETGTGFFCSVVFLSRSSKGAVTRAS